MVLFYLDGEELLWMPWTFDGNNRKFVGFMAKVLGGEAFYSY